MFGAWPRLSDVDEPWFVILAVLEACSLACLWWLSRIALAHPRHPVPDGAADRPAQPPPRLGWGTAAAAQLAGNAAGSRPGGCRHRWSRPGQGPHPVRAASRCGGVGAHGHQPAGDSGAVDPSRAHHPGPDHRAAAGEAAAAGVAGLVDLGSSHRCHWGHGADLAISRGRDRHGHRTCSPCVLEVCDATVLRTGSWRSARGSPLLSRSLVDGRVRWAANRMFDYAALVAALVAFGAHVRPPRCCSRMWSAGVRDHPDHPRWCGLRRRGVDHASSPGRCPRRHRAHRHAALPTLLVLAADPDWRACLGLVADPPPCCGSSVDGHRLAPLASVSSTTAT